MPRRQRKKNMITRRRSSGGGYGFNPITSAPIVAGSLPVMRYTGPGTDCAEIPSNPVLHQGVSGLKGFVGGSRSRNRTHGGRYGFDGSSGLMSAPFVRTGCSMRGGSSIAIPPAYYAATAGYSPKMDTSAGTPMTLSVGYPDKTPNMACLKTSGGSRRRNRSKSKKSKRSKKH